MTTPSDPTAPPSDTGSGTSDGHGHGPHHTQVASAFARHHRLLWGLAYRMLGAGDDADDVVQETFLRLQRSPPKDLDAPLKPWLVRVAMNLARDTLRRRKSRAYIGPWLPGPIDTGEFLESTAVGPDARYGLLESLSLGFLIAAEKLTPSQRSVMVLRDVFGQSVRETASALEMSESNVRVTHHRAREAMREWEDKQRRRLGVPHERVMAAMERFIAAIAAGNVAAAESMLAADVMVISDGGGEFFASRRPLCGATKVAKLYAKLAATYGQIDRVHPRTVNGQPALEFFRSSANSHEGEPPRAVMIFELDDDHRIVAIRSVLATTKLASLPLR